MPRRLLSYVVTVWAALAVLGPVWAPAFAAEVVFPVGSRVGLELPGGDLKPSTRFPGFEDIDRKVSVTIIDLPAAAYPELERAAESKIQPGLTEPKREQFSFSGGTGKLISAQSQGPDFKTHRWTLVATAAADKDLAMAINVDVPEAALPIYSDAVIRKALATVTFRPTPTQEQLGLLPFTVGELAGFRIVKALPPGSVIMTDGPSDEIIKQSFIVVSIGQGAPEQPDDRAKFARDMLSSAPLRELIPQSAEAMRIGGMPGFEIRANAKGPSDDQLSVVQWVRFGGGSYLRIVGVGSKAEWDTLFPRFRAVRDGIAMR
jgi:hypothetical protein